MLAWVKRVPAVMWWVPSLAIMLIALRPTWGLPLASDDFWLFLSIYGNARTGVWDNAVAYMQAGNTSGAHLNPVAYFLDALLNGAMLESTSPIFTPTAMHYGVIAACSLLTLVAASSLASRLLAIASGTVASASVLSVPIALGFLATCQLTSYWSSYDPVAHLPVFGAFATLVGFTHLALAVRAISMPPRLGVTACAAAAGVVGFLTYEVTIVFAAALVGIVWAFKGRLESRTLMWTLPWVVVVPLLTFTFGRIYVSGHPSTYEGTQVLLGGQTLRSWGIGTLSTLPGATWHRAVELVGWGRLGPGVVISGLLAGGTLLLWMLLLRPTLAARSRASATGSSEERSPLRALMGILPLALLAPLPFAASRFWGEWLGHLGNSYMNTLVGYWCWAIAATFVLFGLLRRLQSRWALALLALVLASWTTTQVVLNVTVAARLRAAPPAGIDVLKVLEDGSPESEAKRCLDLAYVDTVDFGPAWVAILNREYEERHGEPFCEQPSSDAN